MNSYFVIGNPIDHSLSPLLHNYWFKKYKIQSEYKKKKLEENDLKDFTNDIRSNHSIKGANVTVPFKKKIIPFLDELSKVSEITGSVNTIIKQNGKLLGDNTDATAFEDTLNDMKYSIHEYGRPLTSLIIGAGGVTSSIIFAIEKLNNAEGTYYIMNRTKKNADDLALKNLPNVNLKPKVLDWGDIPKNLDIIINTTSVGLIKDEELNLDFSTYKGSRNTLFYDLIYNPKETNFLIDARKRGNKVINGKMMFILQAKKAFLEWTKVDVDIDDEVLKLLDND